MRLIAIVRLNKIDFPVCLLVLFACAKSQVEIYPESLMSVQADGELLGEAPARFSILSSALNIFV